MEKFQVKNQQKRKNNGLLIYEKYIINMMIICGATVAMSNNNDIPIPAANPYPIQKDVIKENKKEFSSAGNIVAIAVGVFSGILTVSSIKWNVASSFISQYFTRFLIKSSFDNVIVMIDKQIVVIISIIIVLVGLFVVISYMIIYQKEGVKHVAMTVIDNFFYGIICIGVERFIQYLDTINVK